jgi:hypothetical protein
MKKFNGTLTKLKAALAECEMNGDWSERPQNGLHCFRATTGEALNWWPKTKTLQFQGANPKSFEHRLVAVLGVLVSGVVRR